MRTQYEYKYDTKNVKLEAADYEKLKRTQEAAKIKLKRFITIGEIITGLINDDAVIRAIYKAVNE